MKTTPLGHKMSVTPCLIVCSQSLSGVPGSVANILHDAYGIAVDGGLAHFSKLQIEPELWVGDGDSVTATELKKYKGKRHKLAKKKNYTDLEYALHLAGQAFMEGEWEEQLILLGAQGGRFDHDLANLLVIQQWLEEMAQTLGTDACPDVHSYGPSGAWIATLQGCEFFMPKGRVFSVLSLTQNPVVTIKGAKYVLKKQKITHASQGMSNEGKGQVVTVRVHEEHGIAPSPIFVLMPEV